jgi:hypothetical protein
MVTRVGSLCAEEILVICLPLQKRAREQLAARIDEFEAKKFKPCAGDRCRPPAS